MAEPAFAGVGRKPGLELWRIEKLKPVKQAKVMQLDLLKFLCQVFYCESCAAIG